MGTDIDTDGESVISEIRHYQSKSAHHNDKELVVEKVVSDSETARFLARMEEQRLAKPYDGAIDMRDNVLWECKGYRFNDKTHYLDDISYDIFREGVQKHNGELTVGTFEAIMYGDHTMATKPDPEDVPTESPPQTPKTSGPAPAAPPQSNTPSTPTSQRREQNTAATTQTSTHPYHDRYNPDIIPFGYYRKRQEPRLLYKTDIELLVAEQAFLGETKDVSVRGLQVVVTADASAIAPDQTVGVNFNSLQEKGEDAQLTDIAYRVVNVQRADEAIVVTLVRKNPNEPESFNAFMRRFIEVEKTRSKFDHEDEVCTASALLHQRIYTEALTQIPLFMRMNDSGQPQVETLGVTQNNESLIEFFRCDNGQYDWSALCIPTRTRRLAFEVAPTTLRYDPRKSMHRPVGEITLFLYKDGKGDIHSAADFELATDYDTLRMARHALVHEHCRIVKVFAQLIRNYNDEKMNFLAGELERKAADKANALKRNVQGMFALALVADVTDNVKSILRDTTGTLDSSYKLDGLTAWVGNTRINLGAPKRDTVDACVLNKPPQLVRFLHVLKRREERYLAKTKVEVKIDGTVYPGVTRDLSTKGLCVQLDECSGARIGDTVHVGFLSFKGKGDAFDIKNIPYSVVRIEDDDGIRVMLTREKDRFWEEVTVFFNEIIDLNREKLGLCIEDVFSSAIARLHEDVLSAHLLTMPFFLARLSDGKIVLHKVAVSEYATELADFFYRKKHFLDFRALTAPSMITRFYDAMKNHIKSVTSGTRAVVNNDLEIYMYKTKDEQGNTIIESALNAELRTTEEKLAFIRRAMASGDYRFMKIVVAGIRKLNPQVVDAIVNTIRELSPHRANALQKEVEEIVGYGELIDITNNIVYAMERAAENNNYPKIAPDFCSDSRRGKWRILEYATLAVTQKLSKNGKQGWTIIFFAALTCYAQSSREKCWITARRISLRVIIPSKVPSSVTMGMAPTRCSNNILAM